MKNENVATHSKPFRKAFDLMQRAMTEIMTCDEAERKDFSKIFKKPFSEITTMKPAMKTAMARKPKSKPDFRTRQFITLYQEGVSAYEIARRWGVDPHTVLQALTKHGYLTDKPKTEEIQ